MASMPMSLDQPPAQPGTASPLSGVSSMFQRKLQDQQSPSPAGGADNNALQMMAEAVKRGLEQMSKNPAFQMYAERALTIIDQGLKAVSGDQGSQPGAGPAATQPPAPPAGGAGFPG